jgi:Cold shock proteins
MDGYKTLKAGQPVSFEIIQGPKGLHAVAITNAQVPASAQAPAQEVTSLSV